MACSGVGGVVEIAGNAVLHNVGGAAGVGRDDGTAGGHGFEQHEAEGLCPRGQKEGVGGGEGGSEVRALEEAGEVGGGSGEVLLELFAMRAVADQSEADAGHGGEGVAAGLNFFFSREAADVDEELFFGMALGEAGAHFGGGAVGAEGIRIDSATPELNAGNAVRFKLLLHDLRGGEPEVGAIVAGAHAPPKKALKKPEMVVAQVFGQMGVVGDDQRDALRGAEEEARRGEHGGIDGVDDVGTEFPEHAADGGARNGQLEVRVERKAEAGDAVDLGAFVFGDAARGDDEHGVAQARADGAGCDRGG